MAGFENLGAYRASFKVELEREAGRTMQAQKREIGTFVGAKLIDGTPVDTGEARQGWHASVGQPTNRNVRSGDAISELIAALGNELAWRDPLFWQNNVPHARILEYGLFEPPDPGPSRDPRPGRSGRVLVAGGFSTQAPRGIMGDAVAATVQKFGLATVAT